MSDLKEGDKFKKNDILARDKNFFTESLGNTKFNIGSFQKIACMSSYTTFEDATFITNKLTEDMASEIVYQKQIQLGKNSNVDYFVKIGDTIKSGEPLIQFEQSFEEENLNKFLKNIGEELKEEIKNLGKTAIKSKVSGVVEDIKIYCTVELEELSPSLRNIVKGYYDSIKKENKIVEKYDKGSGVYKAGVLFTEPSDKTEPTRDGKVKGIMIEDGVLIEVYIKYIDRFAVGDKLTYYSALKSIVSEIIPEGYEPYSEFRPDEEVSTFVSPGAVQRRMTPSILKVMFGNKVLVELKRKLEEIYNE